MKHNKFRYFLIVSSQGTYITVDYFCQNMAYYVKKQHGVDFDKKQAYIVTGLVLNN